MKDAPGLLTDQAADVEAEVDDQPDIEPDLSNTDPERAIIHCGKRYEDLREGEVNVAIAQQDQRVEQGKCHPQYADIFVDRERSWSTGPQPSHFVGDADPQRHGEPQDRER